MKLFKIITFIALSLLTFTSCEDKDKQLIEYGEPGTRAGSLVIVDFDAKPAFNAADLPNSAISGTLTAPANNVASYSLKVYRLSEGSASDVFDILTVTSFPSQFNISLEEIMASMGLTLDDVVAGDRFEFFGESVSTDGLLVTANSLDDDLLGEPGQKVAYRFNASVSCPFVPAEIEGTYQIVALGFAGFFGEDLNAPRTVVAGPGENQFTIVEGEYPTQNSDPLIVTVDPETGNVLAVNEDGIAFDGVAQGFPPNYYLLVEGSVFSCTGYIDLRLNFTPFSGNPHDFILQKIN